MNRYRELWSLLTAKQKRDYLLTQILIIFSAVFEVVGVSALVPFISLFTSPDIVMENHYMNAFYKLVNPADYNQFIFIVGLCVIGLLILSNTILAYTGFRTVWFGARIRHEFSSDLKDYYMDKEYLFHVNNNSSGLINKIIVEVDRFSRGVVYQILRGTAKLFLAVFFLIGFIVIDPLMALMFFTLIGGGYFVIYRIFKGPLDRGGKIISEQSQNRVKFLNEGFGGIKDLKILGNEEYYKKNFRYASFHFNRSWSKNDIMSDLPKFVLEAFVLSSLVGLMLVMMKLNEQNLSKVLPILSFYAIAGYKLLPAVNALYEALSKIKANFSVLDGISDDLRKAKSHLQSKKKDEDVQQKPLAFETGVTLQDVSFAYPGTQKNVIDSISLNIEKNSTIALVGSSGSGKTTLVDILLGLLEPQKGKILLDSTEIDSSNRKSWQSHLGYVPQTIYLSDDTVAQNIAFGSDAADINWERMKSAVELSNLKELIDTLPEGLETTVGERGVQLSGGQRQRIGIARALYYNASILIFDEATSALDGITEARIMESINNLAHQKTIIIIAHRLTTVQKADCIYLLGEGGKILDKGNYEELLSRNAEFQKMSGQSE